MAGTGSIHEIGFVFDRRASLEGDTRPILSCDLDAETEIDQAAQDIKADLDRAVRTPKHAPAKEFATGGVKLASRHRATIYTRCACYFGGCRESGEGA